jgi:hypothetical protein
MNKQLFDSYKKLSVTAKSEMRFRLKDSPVGLSFIEFFEKCTNRNFRNSDAVEHIYKEELEKKPYAVLENRFFKLRKKINDEFLSAVEDEGGLLPAEELELHQCKQLVRDNEKETAYQRLIILERDCWAKNIFELLPAILDQLIFCNQSFNRLERNDLLYDRLEKAIDLQADMARCMMIARKAYEINFRSGIKMAKKELEMLKDLAVKHAEYKRFDMCYHHVSLYYKLGSADYINEMQVISRHYASFKKLNALHPLMPLIGYRVNYTAYQHFHFQLIAVFYHFNRCEFEEAHAAMKEMWEMMEKDRSIFGIYKTESSYFNMINSLMATERYPEADKIADQYFNFLKENNQADKIPFAHTLKAHIWCSGWPKINASNVNFLLSKVEEHSKALKKQDNVLLSLGEVEMLKAKIHFLNKEYKKAGEQLKNESAKKFIHLHGLDELYPELFSIALEGRTGANAKQRKEELKKKITSARYLSKSPTVLMQLRWLTTQLAGL